MRSYVSRPFLLVLPNVSDEGILVAELHRTFIALKFPLFGMNLEVNLEIRNMFQTQPALPLCYARVTLSVMAQTFLQGEKMLPTILFGADQHPVSPKQVCWRRPWESDVAWGRVSRVSRVSPVPMEGAVPGQTVSVGGVVATAGPATEEPHDCTGRSLSSLPPAGTNTDYPVSVVLTSPSFIYV